MTRAGADTMGHMDPVGRVTAQLTARLALLGAASTRVGGVLARRSSQPALHAFGTQTAAWGVVDLVIAGVGAARSSAPPNAGRLRAVLVVNAALDVGYVIVGALIALRRPDVRGRLGKEAARGHGSAVVVQGALLLALDVVHARALNSGSTRCGNNTHCGTITS